MLTTIILSQEQLYGGNMTEEELYNKGSDELPLAGRYTVSMELNSSHRVILEKTINSVGEGKNHIPAFCLRKFAIPSMNFPVLKDCLNMGVTFYYYENRKIVDRLRKIATREDTWIGKIFWIGETKEQFLDYFILRRKR